MDARVKPEHDDLCKALIGAEARQRRG